MASERNRIKDISCRTSETLTFGRNFTENNDNRLFELEENPSGIRNKVEKAELKLQIDQADLKSRLNGSPAVIAIIRGAISNILSAEVLESNLLRHPIGSQFEIQNGNLHKMVSPDLADLHADDIIMLTYKKLKELDRVASLFISSFGIDSYKHFHAEKDWQIVRKVR